MPIFIYKNEYPYKWCNKVILSSTMSSGMNRSNRVGDDEMPRILEMLRLEHEAEQARKAEQAKREEVKTSIPKMSEKEAFLEIVETYDAKDRVFFEKYMAMEKKRDTINISREEFDFAWKKVSWALSKMEGFETIDDLDYRAPNVREQYSKIKGELDIDSHIEELARCARVLSLSLFYKRCQNADGKGRLEQFFKNLYTEAGLRNFIEEVLIGDPTLKKRVPMIMLYKELNYHELYMIIRLIGYAHVFLMNFPGIGRLRDEEILGEIEMRFRWAKVFLRCFFESWSATQDRTLAGKLSKMLGFSSLFLKLKMTAIESYLDKIHKRFLNEVVAQTFVFEHKRSGRRFEYTGTSTFLEAMEPLLENLNQSMAAFPDPDTSYPTDHFFYGAGLSLDEQIDTIFAYWKEYTGGSKVTPIPRIKFNEFIQIKLRKHWVK